MLRQGRPTAGWAANGLAARPSGRVSPRWPVSGRHTGACKAPGRLACLAAAQPGVEASAGSSGGGSPAAPTAAIKQQLLAELEGIDRGIFGAQAAKRAAVADLVARLEAANPLPDPTKHLDRVAGDWRLLYTTIQITGARKTKLGLREFVKLGDFLQRIDTGASTAVNVVDFSVSGLGTLRGSLTIRASYAPVSDSRVAITFKESTLVPSQLQQIFQANYDLLLSIFNPEGWLDITYVDEQLRVGRDDKGNLFLLERC